MSEKITIQEVKQKENPATCEHKKEVFVEFFSGQRTVMCMKCMTLFESRIATKEEFDEIYGKDLENF